MDLQPSPIDWSLIERYIAGDVAGNEYLEAERLIATHPRLHEMLAVMQQQLDLSAGGADRISPEQAYERLAQRLRNSAGGPAHSALREGHRIERPHVRMEGRGGAILRSSQGGFFAAPWKRYVFGGALAAATLLIATWGRRRITTPISESSVASRTYTTKAGERRTIALTDGSRITLAPQTTVVVADAPASRTVSLMGEAYFEVASARHTPFVVRTSNTTTRVLGTAFDVRQYADDQTMRLSVVSGKVAVSAKAGESLTIPAGVAIRVTDSTAVALPGTAASYSAWVNGDLVFTEVPASEILKTVGQWYGYNMYLPDSALASRVFTATLDARSAPNALAVLRGLLKVTMSVQHRTITLTPDVRRTHVPALQREMRNAFPNPSEVGR